MIELPGSTGRRALDAFRDWFGDSKVVDAAGKPLVVYHGTGANIEVFTTKGGAGKSSNTGAFFSSCPAAAGTYATGEAPNSMPVFLSLKSPAVIDAGGKNWNAIRQSATMRLPAIMAATALMQVDETLLAQLEGREPEQVEPVKKQARTVSVRQLFPGEWDYPDETVSTDDLARWARINGYDGLIIQNVIDHGPSGRFSSDTARLPAAMYVAFHPEQIKSAIGNSGAFDSADPRICFKRAVPAEQAATEVMEDDELEASFSGPGI